MRSLAERRRGLFCNDLPGLPADYRQSSDIEGLTKVVNLTYGFIPANMGVYEGGNELIMKTIGYGNVPGVGVALALVRRGASLCGNLIGVVILFCAVLRRRAAAGQTREKPTS